MANFFGGMLPPLRLNHRNVLSLWHTDGVGLSADNANKLTIRYADGTTATFTPFAFGASATGLICVVTPTVAGPCTLFLDGTNDDLFYRTEVVRTSDLERSLGICKRTFSLVNATKTPSSVTAAFIGGSAVGTTTLLFAGEAVSTGVRAATRLNGASRMSGWVHQVRVRLATVTANTKWMQFGVWRYNGSNAYTCMGLTEKLGATASGADVTQTLTASADNTFTFRRPVYARAGDYFGIVVNQTGATESCFGGDNPGGGSPPNIYYKNAAPTGVGSDDTTAGFSTLSGRVNIDYKMESPLIVHFGDSWSAGYTANQTSFDTTWDPVDATSDPSILLATRLGIGDWSYLNSGKGGNTFANLLTRIATDLTAWEPALALIQAGGNDVAGSSSNADYDTFITTIFGAGSIYEKCLDAGIRPILCNTGPFDSTNATSYTRAVGGSAAMATAIDDWNDRLRRECAMRGVPLFDSRGVMGVLRSGDTTYLHDLNSALRSDTVHPDAGGYGALCDKMISFLQYTPGYDTIPSTADGTSATLTPAAIATAQQTGLRRY